MTRHLLAASLLLAAFVVVTPDAIAQPAASCGAEWLDRDRFDEVLRAELGRLDPGTRADAVLRVDRCRNDEVRIVAGWAEQRTASRTVSLADVEPEARTRTVALMLAELLRLQDERTDAPRHASTAGLSGRDDTNTAETVPDGPEHPARTDRERRSDGSRSASASESAPAGALDPPPPASEVTASQPAAPKGSERPGPWAGSIDGGVQVYPMHATVAGKARLWLRWRWLLLGTSVIGTTGDSSLGRVRMFDAGLAVGARPWETRHGSWGAELRLWARAGYARARAFPNELAIGHSIQRVSIAGVAGLQGRRRFGEAVLHFGIEAGWHRGLVVSAAGNPIGGLDGVTLGATLGMGWNPA